jgi:hypothetical protein
MIVVALLENSLFGFLGGFAMTAGCRWTCSLYSMTHTYSCWNASSSVWRFVSAWMSAHALHSLRSLFSLPPLWRIVHAHWSHCEFYFYCFHLSPKFFFPFWREHQVSCSFV